MSDGMEACMYVINSTLRLEKVQVKIGHKKVSYTIHLQETTMLLPSTRVDPQHGLANIHIQVLKGVTLTDIE